jgi:hypothetical protein
MPGSPGRLGALLCHLTSKLFIVDMGSVYSVIPHSSSDPATGPAITSAAGKPIPCWGWRTMAVRFGTTVYRWKFLLAAVAFPLLGADFLRNFRLVVDLHLFSVYCKGSKPIHLVAPPAGSIASLIGVQPAAAAAVSFFTPGPGKGGKPGHMVAPPASSAASLKGHSLSSLPLLYIGNKCSSSIVLKF